MDEQNTLDFLQIWNLANGSVSMLPINFPVVIGEICDGQKKEAKVIPIFKKAEKEDPGSYKLRTLTSVSWKIFSHINHFWAHELQDSD